MQSIKRKWKAAQEYCADRRIEFKIITEENSNQMNRIEPILDELNGETMDQEQQMMIYHGST